MIFLTVGTQLPFDRLTRAVDEWCEATPGREVFGQIADPGPRGYHPVHFKWKAFLEPAEFDRCFHEAELVIAHAGMGSIITALTLGKPVLILPRRAELREQRNDHQLATASRFSGREGVHVAGTETEVAPLLDQLLSDDRARSRTPANTGYADERLITCLRTFIQAT